MKTQTAYIIVIKRNWGTYDGGMGTILPKKAYKSKKLAKVEFEKTIKYWKKYENADEVVYDNENQATLKNTYPEVTVILKKITVIG